MELVIASSGRIRCIYDEVIDLPLLGALTIRRASHVEPTADGLWQADLRPVGGPLLAPLPKRSDALAAEQRWLQEHWLVPGQSMAALNEDNA